PELDVVMELINNRNPRLMTFTADQWEQVEDLISKLHQERINPGLATRAVTFATLINLMAVVLRGRTCKYGENSVVSRCLELIDNHLDRGITVAQIAAAIPVSPKYLSSCFRRTIGMELRQYIWLRRVWMAQSLMRSEESSSLDF